MSGHKKIKVLVVDDSALMRKMIPLILEKDPDIEVIATAVDGRFALNKAAKYRSDVITLISTCRDGRPDDPEDIVSDYGIPVVIVSSLTVKGAELTMKAFELGALEVVAKPADAISVHIRISRRAYTQGRNSRQLSGKAFRASGESSGCGQGQGQRRGAIGIRRRRRRLTGGPNALSHLLRCFRRFSCGCACRPAYASGFTEVFANRLNKVCALRSRRRKTATWSFPGGY
jgi:two-component system chemotaxis response regulator CheB